MAEFKKLKCTIHEGTTEFFETLNRPNEKAMLEDLTIQIVQLITEKGLNTRQFNALCTLVNAEIKECKLG